jgi:hypothetical protein
VAQEDMVVERCRVESRCHGGSYFA